jgi:hypothetical protein
MGSAEEVLLGFDVCVIGGDVEDGGNRWSRYARRGDDPTLLRNFGEQSTAGLFGWRFHPGDQTWGLTDSDFPTSINLDATKSQTVGDDGSESAMLSHHREDFNKTRLQEREYECAAR